MSRLRVRDLTLRLRSNGAELLRGVNLDLKSGQAIGLVGESGCGKSLFALSLLGLLSPAIEVSKGTIRLDDEELVGASEEKLRNIRGGRLAMVFQEPSSALNPVHNIGSQITEVLHLHHPSSRAEERRQAVELLEQVGLEGRSRYDSYPHELSGGQRQRVVIAMALAGKPAFLLADEPTTALDTTIQKQILDLLDSLRTELELGLLLISHDLAVVRDVCERAVVLYAGQVVEEGPVEDLFLRPSHPYTQGLLAARLGRAKLDSSDGSHGPGHHDGRITSDSKLAKFPSYVATAKLPFIAGVVPEPGDLPDGCSFAPRCPQAFERCRQEASELWPIPSITSESNPNNRSRCHLAAPEMSEAGAEALDD